MRYGKSNLIILVLFLATRLSLYAQVDSLEPAAQPAKEVVEMSAFSETIMAGSNDLSFKTVESVSYKLYLNKNWKDLSVFVEKMIRSGFDYYYLRVRSGIAYFELGQYRKATGHFKKALAFNTGDDYATSYLYYCYIYSGRYEDAKWLSKTFSPALAESMKSKDFAAMDYLLVENGIKKTVDSTRLFKNPFYMNIGLAHSIERRIFLFHNFSYFTQKEARFNVDQFQYYLRASLPLKNDLMLAGGLHIINVSSNVRSFVPVAVTRTFQPQGQNSVLTETLAYTYNEKLTFAQSINYIGSVNITKHTSIADLSIGFTSATFDSTFQNQVNLGFTLYPFQNNKLAIGSNFYFHKEDKTNINLAVSPYISYYITPKINIQGSYFYNEGPNVTEGNGYFVSNSVDYTLHRMAATGSVKINTAIWLFGTYGYEIKKHLSQGYHYRYRIVSLGLKIIPQFK